MYKQGPRRAYGAGNPHASVLGSLSPRPLCAPWRRGGFAWTQVWRAAQTAGGVLAGDLAERVPVSLHYAAREQMGPRWQRSADGRDASA